jgi:hypothetical protein
MSFQEIAVTIRAINQQVTNLVKSKRTHKP